MSDDPSGLPRGDASDDGAQESATAPVMQTDNSRKPFDLGRIENGVTNIPVVRGYAERIGATLRSLRKLVVTERRGAYFVDLAEIRFSPSGDVSAPEGYEPTEAEKAAIAEAWPRYKWPKYEPCLFSGPHLPADQGRFPFMRSGEEQLAIFWDQPHQFILMVEERRPNDRGSKDLYIWTHWSDGKWRIGEPDRLPLFGLDRISNAITIFVHEGPKAAKAMQRLIEKDFVKGQGGWRDHPWGEALGGGNVPYVAHVAWAGGAMRPEATDFSPLKATGASIIFIADNDRPGMDAISRIA